MKHSRNIDELEQIAARLRRAAYLESVKAFDVVDAVLHWATVFPGLKLVQVANDQLPGAEAEANSATNTILVTENTLQGAKDWKPRQRFIVVEEICHIALGHTGPRHRNCSNRPIGYTYGERLDEREARCLAGLVLAPTELAVDCSSVQELMEQFFLSYEAAQIRWEQLEKYRRHAVGQKRELPPGIIDFLKAQKRKGYKVTVDLDDDD